MVEHQSCASLVNASTLSAMEQEVKEDNVNAVAEISAQLERERQKNVELVKRISMLEAQIRERNTKTQENNHHGVARNFKNCKRKKIEMVEDEIENMDIVKKEYKPDDNEVIILKEVINSENPFINSMSMDDSQILHFDKFKDCHSVADFNKTDSEDAFNDTYFDNTENNQTQEGIDDTTETVSAQKCYLAISNVTCMETFSVHVKDPIPAGNITLEVQENQKTGDMLLAPQSEKVEDKTRQGNEIKEAAACTEVFEVPSLGSVRVSQNKKPQKVAFCPKEVKRIIESEAVEQKNAQSHTIRKIIVFASLGIRHGCEDMHELNFNHFSILKKGEPYVSPKNPGEHVLYENPGVRRNIFYPNRQNTVLCPVQILEEESVMRPSDASCPSCLFLCIKYGGRTRNLPQNEYVRQGMGRNKLKSFGPLICRMAMLVHVRNGSFFFKALGITLLFMAGFPDDLVQRETKYQNLDLLKKYYRTDDNAEGEDLFLQHPIACNNGTHEPQNSTKKVLPAKSKGRKHSNAITKSHDLLKSPPQQPTPMTMSSAATQYGLTGFSSAPTCAITPFYSMPSQISQNSYSHMPNPALSPYSTNVTGNHSSYQMLPPQPAAAASTFLPVMYWPPPPPPTAFFPGPYPSTFGYQYLPSNASYLSFQTRPYYYNHPTCNFSLEKLLDGREKNETASDETESDTDSSSGGCTEHKQGP